MFQDSKFAKEVSDCQIINQELRLIYPVSAGSTFCNVNGPAKASTIIFCISRSCVTLVFVPNKLSA